MRIIVEFKAPILSEEFRKAKEFAIFSHVLLPFSTDNTDNQIVLSGELKKLVDALDDRLVLYISTGSTCTDREFDSILKALNCGVANICVPTLLMAEEMVHRCSLVDRSRIWIKDGAKLTNFDSLTDSSNRIPPISGKVYEEMLIVSGESALDAFLNNLKTDRQDGLYTVVVCDESNIALGLVYSSKESISSAIQSGKGVYYSRSRQEIWEKGSTSGASQILKRIDVDCDSDALKFTVVQSQPGFCHLNTSTCFGDYKGLRKLEQTIQDRLDDQQHSKTGSYTAKLLADPSFLDGKIMEEAGELRDACTSDEVLWEATDLIYFALTKCAKYGVSISDIEKQLDQRSRKVTRRPGLLKPTNPTNVLQQSRSDGDHLTFEMKEYSLSDLSAKESELLTRRPLLDTAKLKDIIKPIMEDVKSNGDSAVLQYTQKFDNVSADRTVFTYPFTDLLNSDEDLDPKIRNAIDIAYDNIHKFHFAQIKNERSIEVETMPGVNCTRFRKPIENVGLYVPGGSATLPSTALMLGVPAVTAGCKTIVIACPPSRTTGRVCAEIVYIARKLKATHILAAGGAQAIAAMAYGTQTVPKVNKICGPGNQYVTGAKMFVQNDPNALVSIDMPAGPSEVLVVADETCTPEFVAADLLSQAEHGVDSQVVLVSINLAGTSLLADIKAQVTLQGERLPRKQIVSRCLANSFILNVNSEDEAMKFSNDYAPEHLILHVRNPQQLTQEKVVNAGSVFLGPYTPESCGDYASGTNHTLPTYGYAKMYSGVSTGTFSKYITAQEISKSGLEQLAETVTTLAEVEQLEAHKQAVLVRLRVRGR